MTSHRSAIVSHMRVLIQILLFLRLPQTDRKILRAFPLMDISSMKGTPLYTAMQIAALLFNISYLFLDLVTDDLVRIQIQIKAGTVASVNRRALRLVCVVYNTVFAVLHISVNFAIEVCAETVMQVLFVV